ncbi:hypothetical protein BDZ91DRAFT_791220 [Kalaharituber pfeilii]|nr:hypothetical protein BDZ91DRAFT_791220 [Kalaharituber pfeilii]
MTHPTFRSPLVIDLGPSTQGASRSLIVLPSGVQLLVIVIRQNVSGGPETFSDSLPNVQEDQSRFLAVPPYALNTYTGNAGNAIYDSVFIYVSSAVPAPYSNHSQIVNDPMVEYSSDESQEIGEVFNNIVDQGDMDMRESQQAVQHIPNAVPQQPQNICWQAPNVPHDFVPAPEQPEYTITFQEPVTFTPHLPHYQ